jgi:uncharacterized membrane protein (UPF0182 family)
MLVIPINRALLYVEPIYLQAERSPMPELRLVVLATQDRLAYGASFNEALANLFGEANSGGTAPTASQTSNQVSTQQTAAPGVPTNALSPTTRQLIERAYQEFSDYQRLTAEGRLREAGEKLEAHKRTLDDLRKAER